MKDLIHAIDHEEGVEKPGEFVPTGAIQGFDPEALERLLKRAFDLKWIAGSKPRSTA